MSADRDGTIAEQAIGEVSLIAPDVWDLVADMFADREHAWDVCLDAAHVAEDAAWKTASPSDVRACAASIGMALGVRLERVRQRRHGNHPTEVLG